MFWFSGFPSLQAFFLLRQQQGRPCLAHLDRPSPTRRSAVALLPSSNSNRTHLPQPPATHCLNKPPSLSSLFVITMLSKAKNQPHFLHNLCQKEKTLKLYRMTQTESHITWSTLSQVFSQQPTSFVLHSQNDFREKKNNIPTESQYMLSKYVCTTCELFISAEMFRL